MKKKNLIIIIAIYIIISLFLLSPFRSKISETENRKLMDFPKYTLKSLFSGEYFDNISKWFTDTVPYRDKILKLYFKIMEYKGLKGEEHLISIDNINKEDNIKKEDNTIIAATSSDAIIQGQEKNTYAYSEENGVIEQLKSNLITFGKKENLRVVEGFWGWTNGDEMYAYTINEYHKKMPDVNMYVMIAPSAIEFYCPEKYKNFAQPQEFYMQIMYGLLDPAIKFVNPVPVLREHVDENIYFRTDHHWSPLGAYYAAQEFSKVAQIDFKDLSYYDEHVLHGFTGSMYSYTNEVLLREYPEDFVYYVPNKISFKATRRQFNVDGTGRIVGEGEDLPSPFFYPQPENSQTAYMTFMHGDSNLTHIEIVGKEKNNRNLLLIKDSFGNAIPGYLFYSYDNIYVIDYRYFNKYIEDFVSENNITDVLFVNNIVQTKKDLVSSKLRMYLKP